MPTPWGALKSVEDIEDSLAFAKKTGSLIEKVDEAYGVAKRAYTWYQNKRRWTVTIASSDRLYDAVLRWFLSEESNNKPPRSVKAGLAASRRASSFFEDDVVNRGPRKDPVSVFYDERGQRTLNVDGHKITVMLFSPEHGGRGAGGEGYRPVQPDQLYFYATSKDGQDAVISMLNRIASDQDKRKPALHLMDNWGDWSRRDDLPERQLSSVILKRGQMERLRDDLQQFLEDEDEYVRRGMPYHRGYLLHGPPGTGKTSIVRALAAEFGLDLWYAPLGDLQKDTSLLTLINRVKPGSILLLEDVDIFHSTREREDDGGGLSMAGLLNALDGVATPHGLITFMTTNDITVIDDAVIRPGRIDVREEVSLPDQDQIARLFESWYDTELLDGQVDLIGWNGTPAALTELFKQNLNDRDTAWRLLQKRSRTAEERPVTVPASGGKL